MKKALAHLKSVSPYQQGKFIATKKTRDETYSEFEANHWRERMHVDEKGFVFIPPMSFKNCLSEAAKYKSIQIPGKGKSTYTKHFEAGILCVEPLVLPVKDGRLVLATVLPALMVKAGKPSASSCQPNLQPTSHSEIDRKQNYKFVCSRPDFRMFCSASMHWR